MMSSFIVLVVAFAFALTLAIPAASTLHQDLKLEQFPNQPLDYPTFTGEYGENLSEHHRFGYELGTRFSREICDAINNSKKDGLLSIILPFVQTETGANNLTMMIATHEQAMPKYMEELRGMALATNIDFNTLFMLNVGESLSTVADPYTADARFLSLEHCSNYILWPWDAHNEDGGASDFSEMYWTNVTIDGANFMGLVYAGLLPSGAFGWNSFGIGFSLNWVGPYDADAEGLGRGFITRDLLRAKDIDDALAITTSKYNHATGHTIQLHDYVNHTIYNVEVAPFRRWAVRDMSKGAPPLFHANTYLNLKNIKQYESQSSLHRLARAKEMAIPTNITMLLTVLGDVNDHVQPIFHDRAAFEAGDKSGLATLTTMVFDVVNNTAVMYHGNPKNQNIHRVFNTKPWLGKHIYQHSSEHLDVKK